MSSGSPWVRFFASDWLAGTRMLSASETGVYITLVAMMYDRGEPLPADDLSPLARQCNLPPYRFEAALDRLVAEGKIIRTDEGKLWNDRVQREHEVRLQTRAKARANAETRWTRKASKTNGAAMPAHFSSNARARVLQKPEEIEDTSVSLSPAHFPPNGGQARVSERAPEDEFQTWYKHYPLKRDRGHAELAFRTARKQASLQELLDGVVRYKRDKLPERPWQYPATWLRGKGWLDEPEPQTATNQYRATGPPDEGQAFRDLLRRKAEGN